LPSSAVPLAILADGIDLSPGSALALTTCVPAVSLDMWRADLGRGLSRLFALGRGEEKRDRSAAD